MKIRIAWVLLMWSAGCGLVHAQAADAPVPLARAVDAAWSRALENQEAVGRRQRARASREVAQSWSPSPAALELSQRSDRWHADRGQREQEIGVAWPLWLPGQRQAATAAASSETSELSARLKVAGAVRESAWYLLTKRAESTRAIAHADLLERLAVDVERRATAGELARSDVLAIRAEWLEAQASALDVRQALDNAERRWTLLTGLKSLPDATERTTGEYSPTQHPDGRRAVQEAELARVRVELARASRREPPELLLTAREDRSAFGDAPQRSIGLSLRIPLGSSSRSAPLMAAALSERDIALTRANLETERVEADLATARSAVTTAKRQADAESSRAALLRERAQLIDTSFRAGESPLPDLLRALAAANLAEAAKLLADANVGLARARLHQAMGLMP
jgi:outer membrane protein, heavy metal efflux system